MPLDEPHDLVLGPVAIIGCRLLRDEPAMAAVLAHDEIDMSISREPGIVERLRRDERIVLGSDDERRQGDAIDDSQRAGAMVVVAGVPESEIWRGVRLVKITHGANAPQPLE